LLLKVAEKLIELPSVVDVGDALAEDILGITIGVETVTVLATLSLLALTES
jgi:hypothetical protein